MKLLHTSDWHLGVSLYGNDRFCDSHRMLNNIITICKNEHPEVFIIAGDIFDVARPSAKVQKLLVDSLLKIHTLFPDMIIIMIPGNHDSLAWHNVFAQPWSKLNVHVFSEWEMKELTFPGICRIVASPYINERFIDADYYQSAISNAAEKSNNDSLPLIAVLHTTIEGCDFSGHRQDSEMNIGGISATNINAIGQGYDYLAVGHIHHAQNIAPNARYCGSPMPMSFDENYTHSVTIVEIEAHNKPINIKEIPLTNCGLSLITLPKPQTYASWDDIVKLVNDYPIDQPAYIRLNVKSGFEISTFQLENIRNILEEKGAILCFIDIEQNLNENTTTKNISLHEFQEMSTYEVAIRYFNDKQINLSDEELSLLKGAIDMLKNDELQQI